MAGSCRTAAAQCSKCSSNPYPITLERLQFAQQLQLEESSSCTAASFLALLFCSQGLPAAADSSSGPAEHVEGSAQQTSSAAAADSSHQYPDGLEGLQAEGAV